MSVAIGDVSGRVLTTKRLTKKVAAMPVYDLRGTPPGAIGRNRLGVRAGSYGSGVRGRECHAAATTNSGCGTTGVFLQRRHPSHREHQHPLPTIPNPTTRRATPPAPTPRRQSHLENRGVRNHPPSAIPTTATLEPRKQHKTNGERRWWAQNEDCLPTQDSNPQPFAARPPPHPHHRIC